MECPAPLGNLGCAPQPRGPDLTLLSGARINTRLPLLPPNTPTPTLFPPCRRTVTDPQDEVCSFNVLSQRASASGELLLGYVEQGSGRLVLNPPRKAEPRISRASVEALVTIATS